jgi:hypothetical protein
MKTNRYMNVILTVIAGCLVILTLQNLSLIPQATASGPNQKPADYALLPVNGDGTVDVNIKRIEDKLNVNIEQIGGYGCYNGIPVIVKNN